MSTAPPGLAARARACRSRRRAAAFRPSAGLAWSPPATPPSSTWGGSTYRSLQARPALYYDLGSFSIALPNSNQTFCMLNPSARTHTAAPHCDSHCHQLRVALTLHILWRQLRTFSGMMLRECGKAGMKPVCEDPSVCKKDAKARSALLRSWAYFQAPFQTRMSLSAC